MDGININLAEICRDMYAPTLLDCTERFNGEYGNSVVQRFIAFIQRYKTQKLISDAQALKELKHLLTGHAFNWWCKYGGRYTTWMEAIKGLKNEFKAQRARHNIFDAIIHQGLPQYASLEAFFKHKREDFLRLPRPLPSESTQLNILYALLPDVIRRPFICHNINSYKKLNRYFRNIRRDRGVNASNNRLGNSILFPSDSNPTNKSVSSNEVSSTEIPIEPFASCNVTTVNISNSVANDKGNSTRNCVRKVFNYDVFNTFTGMVNNVLNNTVNSVNNYASNSVINTISSNGTNRATANSFGIAVNNTHKTDNVTDNTTINNRVPFATNLLDINVNPTAINSIADNIDNKTINMRNITPTNMRNTVASNNMYEALHCNSSKRNQKLLSSDKARTKEDGILERKINAKRSKFSNNLDDISSVNNTAAKLNISVSVVNINSVSYVRIVQNVNPSAGEQAVTEN